MCRPSRRTGVRARCSYMRRSRNRCVCRRPTWPRRRQEKRRERLARHLALQWKLEKHSAASTCAVIARWARTSRLHCAQHLSTRGKCLRSLDSAHVQPAAENAAILRRIDGLDRAARYLLRFVRLRVRPPRALTAGTRCTSSSRARAGCRWRRESCPRGGGASTGVQRAAFGADQSGRLGDGRTMFT
jgi:hypothetical protein